MNSQLLRQAEILGSRPYQMVTFLDNTTDGEAIYVALIPELPGCHTHGETIDEAIDLLNEVKIEFIYFMLVDGLDVPEPKLLDRYVCMNFWDILDIGSTSAAKPSSPIGEFLATQTNALQIA